MTPDQIEALFTRGDGNYSFARWGRPIAPVIFGVQDKTLSVIKGALEAMMVLSGHQMAETDAEFGSNLMIFFMKDWQELLEVTDLDRLIPDLAPLVETLQQRGANQYRIFRFDEAGAIKACFVFLRVDEELAEISAEAFALGQIVRTLLLWSDQAFQKASPLAVLPNGTSVLRPEIAAVIRAAYDGVLPVASQDVSHALRLFARLETV